LDDVTAQASQWCDQARALSEDPASNGPDSLAARLDVIGAGLSLRRQLDELAEDEPAGSTRRAIVRRLTELQVRADADMAALNPGTARHSEVSDRIKVWLADTRMALRRVLAGLRSGPLHQAMAIEGVRTDVDWLSTVVARLDRETPHPVTARLDVELGRLRGWLKSAGRGNPDPRDEPLRAGCERLQAAVLDRRITTELDRPYFGSSPVELWGQRFQLSRLQAQAEALDLASGATPAQSCLAADRALWLGALSKRRGELADAADDTLANLEPGARALPCERIVRMALDEVGETIAFLEDMPLRRAVKRLKLVQGDLDRLALSCRRWSRGEPAGRIPQSGLAAGGGSPPGRTGGLVPTGAPGSALASGEQATAEDFEPGRLGPDSGDQPDQAAARLLVRLTRQIERSSRQVRREWQEKLLSDRMESIFGRRFVAVLENTVVLLILVLIGLIVAEALLERAAPAGLSARQHVFFAWADLAVCSVFLFEFAVKLALAPQRMSYFLRHLLIDLVASLPFGFVAHQIELGRLDAALRSGSGSGLLRRVIQFGRVVLRFFRLGIPLARLARVGLILLRLSDRLVRRMGKLLSRNIILFSPSHAQKPESSDRHRLVALRGELEHGRSAIEARLDRDQGRQLAQRVLGDLEIRIECLPAPPTERAAADLPGREIPVEAVVERLIQMTPERLLDQLGPAFVRAVDRYLRLLDLPLIRRLPVIRNLVAYREKSPAEAVALAANYLGHLIQQALDVVYFFADLHGTLSPPVFLDRLGATIVNATRTPAKRLLWLGSAFLFLFLIVEAVSFLKPFRGIVAKLQALMGWPVIILGVICVAFWLLGAWFRRIANQSADFCERVVEAQFATHTKSLKSRRRDQDGQFLAERVIDPELLLRSADDRLPQPDQISHDGETRQDAPTWFENRELAFLRNVRLLYQDYLDGSPLHRSDTKASVQLLGNLALGNLRRSHLGHLLREGRTIDRLDLSRSGRLFGGPYLWFNYITRMLVQDTAILILDYNRHGVPIDRLACSPDAVREKFRDWLADRLKIEPEEVWLPEPRTSRAAGGHAASSELGPDDVRVGCAPQLDASPRKEAGSFLETVEFTAVDFLADDAERDAEIHARFGPQVAELVRRDRQQNVRRAFRSFPLHELPLASRTINPFAVYEMYLAGGRIVLLPFYAARILGRSILLGIQSIYRVVHQILHPDVDQEREVPSDTYWAALRKIHRMRKPVFMGSLWLRARFDVEYLGLPLPSAPPGLAGQAVMDADLDYIGATRRDRIIAEQVRRQHQKRLEWVARWLDRFGWTFEGLPGYLAAEIPYLANRGGEALRALVAACTLDHNDIATLALSIEGLKRVLVHAADPTQDPASLPGGLPDPVVNLRTLWHPVNRCKRPLGALFELPCFPPYGLAERRRVVRYMRRHRRVVRGWLKVVLGQGGSDPWATVKARMHEVLLRTDLWSDQILVLRAVQSLTMLDLQHNCELVWNLGGYTRPRPGTDEPDAEPPRTPLHHEDEALAASR
jgi:hypothetical protein